MAGAIAFAAFRTRHKYRAIIATGEDVGLPLALMIKLAHDRTPLIMTCHNLTTTRPRLFLNCLGVGSAVSVFQCLSRSQAAMLRETAVGNRGRVHMLYWHVDDHFFRPMPEVCVLNQVCSAGMAAREYATLLSAASDLQVDVKIAADSPWFHQELNIDCRCLPNRIEVRSYGNYVALRQLYAESLAVVVPLLDVNFIAGYTVILEAMAMGKPVIATRTRQHNDLIIDGHNGMYVQPGDVADLREKLAFLLRNPAHVRTMGRNARVSVETRYTLNHYRERMRLALDEVASTVNARREGPPA